MRLDYSIFFIEKKVITKCNSFETELFVPSLKKTLNRSLEIPYVTRNLKLA